VLHTRTFLDELAKFEPAVLQAAEAALAGATQDLGFTGLDRAAFAASPNISVNYAVMERTSAAAMLTADIGSNDIGSWSSLWDIAPQDADGNYKHGEAFLEQTSGWYIRSEKSLVSTIGVEVSSSSILPMPCSSPTNRDRRTPQRSSHA
jgi:mannose-1-phosphate guanylyltransferase / mannose-6-phosphate isomerase